MKYGMIAAVVTAAFVGNMAQAETYICQIKLNGPAKGIIPDVITINMSDRTLNAVVSDAVILATNGNAVVATQLTNTTKRLSVKWPLYSVKGPRNKTYGKIDYNLSICKSRGNKVNATAKFTRYEGAETTIPREARASGNCKLR